MKPQAADGAALVAAAVQAAIQAGAPRRTVAAVAAAVAGTSLSAAARSTPTETRARVPPLDPQKPAEESGDAAQLLERLKAVRKAARLRKKQRRREAKQLQQQQQQQKIYPAVPLFAESAAASPGNTDTTNREQQRQGSHGGDSPSAAASGSQTAAVQRVQIASEDPELIIPADLPAPPPQSDAEDPDNWSQADSSCSENTKERGRQSVQEALAAIARMSPERPSDPIGTPEASAEESFQTVTSRRRGPKPSGGPKARAPASGRR